MPIIIKTKEEIEVLREGGKHLATVLYKVRDMVAPGVSTKDLDLYAEKLIRERGDTPAFLNYRPEGATTPFPASLCVSVNDEVVHGIPRKNRILKEGDIVSLDLGIKHKNLFTDMAITVPVGKITDKNLKLLQVTERALQVGIDAARAGNMIGDIGFAIENFVHITWTIRHRGSSIGARRREGDSRRSLYSKFRKKGAWRQTGARNGDSSRADDKSRHQKCNH